MEMLAYHKPKTPMWTPDKNLAAKGFSTPTWRSKRSSPVIMPATEKKWRSPPVPGDADDFHIIHKVPAGDSPYVRAKHVQLVDKDPGRAISMFWTAINSGDRVDSALKDMAVVMKQLNRSDEAIEAIKSFRHLCPVESQESLDNILLELYKRSGRIEEQIELLQVKLKHIEEGVAFGGKRSKIARSQGKKVQITIEQDYSRLLGNLAWAYLQQNNYKSAEELYRKALSLEPDKNKQCNLAICLMYTHRMPEAKFLLQTVRSSFGNRQMDDSYAKAYERAVEVMDELESAKRAGKDIQTPFAVLLHRKLADGYKKETTLQSSPQAVFGNNMTRGFYSGGQYERRAEFGRKPTEEACFAYRKRSASLSGGSFPEVPFTQPRQCSWSFNKGDQTRGWEREDAVGGCNRKLTFGQTSYAKNVPSGNQLVDVQLTGTVEYVEKTQDISKIKSKNWADMVEEDEQQLFNELTDFPDENRDCNIIHETPIQNEQSENLSQKIASLNLKDGYYTVYTQPGKPASKMNGVKRSLCFDSHQQNAKEENLCSSSLQKKTLDFGNYTSALVKEKERISSNGVNSMKRNRLQVFRDITLHAESPRP